MKYPIDEHELETVYNEYLRRSGCWAHHFYFADFPDTTYVSPTQGTGFIEYAFIRVSDLNRLMIKLFTPEKIARFSEMIASGAQITLIAFHTWAVYSELLTVDKLMDFRTETALAWLDRVNSWDWDNLRGMVRDFNYE